MSTAVSIVRLNNVVLRGIRNLKFERRDKRAVLEDDGAMFQTADAIMRTAPKISFDTVAVRALISTLVTASPTPYVALDGTNGCECIGLLQNATTPGYQAGTVHPRRRFLAGIAALAGVSWRSGDVATARCEVFGLAAAGGTDPVVTGVIAAPTIPNNTEQMVGSNCVIGATTLTRMLSWDVSIGHQIENNVDPGCYDGGLPHPTLIASPGSTSGAVEVTFSIETLDPVGATPLTGATVFTLTALKNQDVGYDTPIATITVNSTTVREEEVSGRPGVRRIMGRGTWNGTLLPVTAAVG